MELKVYMKKVMKSRIIKDFFSSKPLCQLQSFIKSKRLSEFPQFFRLSSWKSLQNNIEMLLRIYEMVTKSLFCKVWAHCGGVVLFIFGGRVYDFKIYSYKHFLFFTYMIFRIWTNLT